MYQLLIYSKLYLYIYENSIQIDTIPLWRHLPLMHLTSVRDLHHDQQWTNYFIILFFFFFFFNVSPPHNAELFQIIQVRPGWVKWHFKDKCLLFRNIASTRESPQSECFTSSKMSQHKEETKQAPSAGSYLTLLLSVDFRETQTAVEEGTDSVFERERPEERSKERLHISTKDGTDYDFVSAMFGGIFYLCDIRTRQWYLLSLLDFVWGHMV